MGRLTTYEALQADLGAHWYFDKYHNKNPNYGLPNKHFPHTCAISFNALEGDYPGNNDLRIAIRKWVETNVDDMVITTSLFLDYYGYREKECRYGREIRHGYQRFFFESEASALLFKLQFGEYISDTMWKFQEDYRPSYFWVRDLTGNEEWKPA